MKEKEMSLDIIEEKNNYIEIVLGGLLIIWLLLDVMFFKEKTSYAVMVFLSILTFLHTIEGFFVRKVGRFNINEKKCEVKRNTGEIIQYDLTDVKYILINQLYYLLSGSISAKSKIVLKISIQKYEREISFIVLLRGKKEKTKMILTLQKLYENNIPVREYDMNGNRSFLFQTNMSYKEIQDIKQKYNLSWY